MPESKKDSYQESLPDFSEMDEENRPPGEVQKFIINMHKIQNRRDNPLLVLFYSEQYGVMRDQDIELIYELFNEEIGNDKIEELDVVLHTMGGNPHVGYRLPRLLHEYANKVNAIVPQNAYSSGTLFCLGCDEIFMTELSELSPIDVKYREPGEKEFIQLVGIDNYTDFIRKLKNDLDRDEVETTIEENLGVELVRQVGALKLGNLFRKRDLTGDYAKELLDNYLLKDTKPRVKEEMKETIVADLLFNNPDHNFRIDKNLAKSKNLPVKELDSRVSYLSIQMINQIIKCENENYICDYLGEDLKMPYIELIGVDDE